MTIDSDLSSQIAIPSRPAIAWRTAFLMLATASALVGVAHYLGFDLWSCAKCSYVREQPISPWLVWAGTPALAALTYGSWRNLKWIPPLLGVASLVSVALVYWMVTNHALCNACLMVHLSVVSAALTLVPRASWLSPACFAIAILYLSTGGWEQIGTSKGTAIFRPRPGEKLPDGPVYVLFTDPECGRCRLAEANLASKPNLKVLHRWLLLPHSAYRTMRAAAVVESIRLQSPEKAVEVTRLLAQGPLQVSDEVILAAARQVGLAEEAEKWLEAPPEAALQALEDDDVTAKELAIQSLPAMAKLSAPDASGTRHITLMPTAEPAK